MIAAVRALFVDDTDEGVYPRLIGDAACLGIRKDARNYIGRSPVIAHPPCNLWVNMAAVNWKRYGRQRPAWYPGGTDEGCFASALASVRRCGGVLEHPAGSRAWTWTQHLLAAPPDAPDPGGWWCIRSARAGRLGEWVCEVWQSAYGHKARKRTWLLYCGKRPPFDLNWSREPGTHQCGYPDQHGKARNKPTVSKRQASATPEAFARELIRLAQWSTDADHG